MRTRVGRRSTALVVAILMVVLPSASIAGSLEEAQAEREQLQERLDDAAERLADVEDRVAAHERERDELARRVATQEEALAEVDERLALRIRQVYKHGTRMDPIAVFLASEEPADALDRAGAVRRLVHTDHVETEEIVVQRTQLRAEAERLEVVESELEDAVAEQREVTDDLQDDLERAKQLEERLEREERERRERERREREEREERERRERAERRQAASSDSSAPSGSSGSSGSSSGGSSPSPSPSTSSPTSSPAPSGAGGMVCPIDNPRSFTDTWGAARSGGRSHRGTDILSPRGTPIRAITSGTWNIRPYGANAGHWAILRGDDGNQYWYMHLDSHTVGNGARVSAGQQTGTNGDTGNARGTPHLHFELHPGGGSAVNPYSLLRRVC